MQLARILSATCLAASLAACQLSGLSEPPATTTPEPPKPQASAESLALQSYYQSAQSELLAQGLLRTDGGGPDVPYSTRDLVDNFTRIAFFSEYQRTSSGAFIEKEVEIPLHRWQKPVRMALYFGDSVPPADQATIRREVMRTARKLALATGHPVRLVSDRPNFHIIFVNEDERRSFGDTLPDLDPDLSDRDADAILTMKRSIFCRVVTISGRTAPDSYDAAFAVIRAEHPTRLRRQCIHEELAQGLGLPNDSKYARPSIFNDDEEFGLLTPHDELLLKMLYDPRLRPGIRAEEARPILEVMASELIPGEV